MCVCVQWPSHVWLFGILWTVACHASLSLTISQSLTKFMSIELVMPSNNLILCHTCLLLPSVFPNIRVFSRVSTLLISINTSNDSSRLISSRIDLFDILAAQGTLRRLLGTLPWRHQLFGTLPSLSSKFHILKWLLETLQLWLYRPLSAK